MLTSEHYRLQNYSVKVVNDKKGLFHAKLTSNGHPYNFSWFECERDSTTAEIHSNLAVAGAHKDGAIYVVDVAVVKGNKVPHAKPKKKWKCLANSDLITFAEVKKLNIYPMLLAQFVGIVHEIKPKSLLGQMPSPKKQSHFCPALISLGYLSGTSNKIIAGFSQRKYRLSIVHTFDAHIAQMKKGKATISPFANNTELI